MPILFYTCVCVTRNYCVCEGGGPGVGLFICLGRSCFFSSSSFPFGGAELDPAPALQKLFNTGVGWV